MKRRPDDGGNGLASLRLHVSIIEPIPQHRLVAHDQTEMVGRKRGETGASSQLPIKSFREPTSPPCWLECPGSAWPRCTGTPSRTSGRRRGRLLTCVRVFRKERVREGGGGVPEQRNTGQTLNMEFSRILSAVVPKLHRSFDGFRVLDVDVA